MKFETAQTQNLSETIATLNAAKQTVIESRLTNARVVTIRRKGKATNAPISALAVQIGKKEYKPVCAGFAALCGLLEAGDGKIEFAAKTKYVETETTANAEILEATTADAIALVKAIDAKIEALAVELLTEKEIEFQDFHVATTVDYAPAEKPDRPADFQSASGSWYWSVTIDGAPAVIRESNHWGEVASCNWTLSGTDEHKGLRAGVAKLSDFNRKRITPMVMQKVIGYLEQAFGYSRN